MLSNNYINKIWWSLAPLAWGILTWFLAFGPGQFLFISYSMRLLIGIILLTTIFYKTLEYRRLHTNVLLFDIPIYFPSWLLFFFTSIVLLIINIFFFKYDTAFLNSMTFIIFAGSLLEEFISRDFFIKYEMKGLEFIIFNFISATTFTLMHSGYSTPTPNIWNLFFERGHFPFAFLLNIIAFKTKRIELPLIIHMLSNFFNCTLPNLILHEQKPAWITLAFDCFQLLLVGGAIAIDKKKNLE